MDMHRHALDKGARQKRAKSAKASTCAAITPARPNTEILMRLTPTEIMGITVTVLDCNLLRPRLNFQADG